MNAPPVIPAPHHVPAPPVVPSALLKMKTNEKIVVCPYFQFSGISGRFTWLFYWGGAVFGVLLRRVREAYF